MVVARYDAQITENLLSVKQQALTNPPVAGSVITRWRSSVSAVNIFPWEMQAIGAPVLRAVRRGPYTLWGVHIPPGSCLYTPIQINLLNHAVFVVVTMHAQSDANASLYRTIVTNRSDDSKAGAILLRLDTSAANPVGSMTLVTFPSA